jgi:glycosyltransferase involved in cell wall biosynthesis
MTDRPTFHLIVGEYPPQPGGVGDYTAGLAAGLASAGAGVHVWTSSAGDAPDPPGVTAHRIGGRWSPADLRRVGRALDAFPAPRRLVVQYTPNTWGYKGLNLGFCRWLVGRRRRGDEVRVMFHEVAYPWQLRDRPARWLLAAGHRWMARTLLKAGAEVDVTTPAWEPTLRACAPAGDRRALRVHWRPVPSNIPVADGVEAAAEAVRRRVAPGGEAVVGAFSSFSELTGPILAGALPRVLLGGPGRVGLLIGQGSDRMAGQLRGDHPALAAGLAATGSLPPAEISAHLRACDLLIQPYPDGATTRRTSLMAGLAHGVAVVTNAGHLTEPFWASSGGVALAAAAGDLAPTAERLLRDPDARARLARAGRDLYERRFAMERTVEALIATTGTPQADPCGEGRPGPSVVGGY